VGRRRWSGSAGQRATPRPGACTGLATVIDGSGRARSRDRSEGWISTGVRAGGALFSRPCTATRARAHPAGCVRAAWGVHERAGSAPTRGRRLHPRRRRRCAAIRTGALISPYPS
jgi:hypothetical protein